MQKMSHENSLPLPRNPKNEMISLSYDVNDYVYSKLNLTNLKWY